jgi:Protein of unknown function (DUF1838)
MSTTRFVLTCSLLLAGMLGPAIGLGAGKAPRIDLEDPAHRLEAFIRANGDTSGKPVATYGTGTVYAYLPGEKPRAVFGLQVVGMSRYEKIEGGYLRLHREIGYYTDLKTGEVIERWFNPWLQREVEVLPIQNDPVNRRYTAAAGNYSYDLNGDDIVFYREVPLRYPNPLDRATYPLNSSGDFYEAMEMFTTFIRRDQLENPRLTSIPSTGTWTRFGPWLPWMEMGAHQGYLVYHSRSFKPADGLAGIPQKLRDFIARDNPKFLSAPEKFTEPDETSWTFFKKAFDERRKTTPGR